MKFESIHFNVVDRADHEVEALGALPVAVRGGGSAKGGPVSAGSQFNSEESAARFYLGRVFERDARSAMRGLAAPASPEVVPDMKLRDTLRSALTGTSTVRFIQTKFSVPIFGSRANVELDGNRELLAIDAEVAEVPDVPAVASLSPAEALERIAKLTSALPGSLQQVEAPELTFVNDEDNHAWRLSYYFRSVPAAPPKFIESIHSHGMGRSLAALQAELDYLVDAHDGKIFLYWSSGPTVDIPSQCSGNDVDGASRQFYGRLGTAGFEMIDPLGRIRTFDFQGKDIFTSSPPANPIAEASNQFSNRSAVSAHVNATLVHQFYKGVLKRDGVDDKGMELISYVNCTLLAAEQPPEWHNATWWKHCMWYGQAKDSSGQIKSFSKHLDVIAHELTHGVTEFTAGLVYLRQSGALNESFSDIFGVIIKNWDDTQPMTGGDVSTWNWEIGAGLGKDGLLPLRDMRDPARTGSPNHMNQYVKTDADNGGVHTNSNIHNKAAFNVLTAVDAQNRRVFKPRDAAVLYYVCLTRLGKLADFSQTLATLVNVAGIYYAGDARRQERLDAIRDAYAKVGILQV